MNRFDINIEDLLPHRDRMLLIDEILEVDDKTAVTRATVTDQPVAGRSLESRRYRWHLHGG